MTESAGERLPAYLCEPTTDRAASVPSFLSLLAVHERLLRERNILYPTLDRVATAQEARELL